MRTLVKFTIGDHAVEADFDDTPTAQVLLEAMPYTTSGNYWGSEFYFRMPVKLKADATAREVVEPGAVAFWVEGSFLCLFCGPTPVSRGSECRAASDVNVVGRVRNPEALPAWRGHEVTVEAVG